MTERVMLFRPLTGELLHPEVDWETGSDTQRLSEPGSIDFTLPLSWQNMVDHRGRPILADRKTLAIVGTGTQNMTIRQVGLVDGVLPVGNTLNVSCGGLSMLPAQSGPWEGHQGYYVTTDVMVLFRRLFEQAQAYANANIGLRVIGDTRTGASLGYPGSARWQNANRDANRLRPSLETWEGRLLTRERTISQRQEAMFKAAGLKRVGNVHQTDDGSNPPDDPGYRADSTLWIRQDQGELGRWGRAYRWRNGRWVSQSQADNAVRRWRGYLSTVQEAKDEVERIKYLLEPIEARLEDYEGEAKEDYSLYFWQNHDLQPVLEELLEMGPIEYRETATWNGERLVPQIEARSPKIGVRRDNIHLELGVNVLERPPIDRGETYTGVALFGAGEGSEVLSAQRDWAVSDAVRNIMVEVDKEAHTNSLTRAAASKLERELKKEAGLGFKNLVIYHDAACPEGSFLVGDEIPVTGVRPDDTKRTEWVRVLAATRQWGSKRSEVEVEAV